MARKYVDKLSLGLLLTLGGLAIVGPFSSDLYLPAFPHIAKALDTTAAGVQFTLTCFTIGLALGQFVLGSVSDRIGRKPVLVLGMTAMGLSSLFASSAQSLAMLIIGLAAMGISSAATQVATRALVSDLAHGPDASRGFSIMGMVLGFGPILGPIVGALLMSFGDWRTIFVGFAIMCAVFTVWALLAIPESLLPDKRHSGGLKDMMSKMGGILRNRNFMWHASIIWAGVGILFAYISASPFVMQSIFGLTPVQYTLVFGINGTGLLLSGPLSGAIVHKFGPAKQVRLAGFLLGVAALNLGAGWAFGTLNLIQAEVSFFLTLFSMGFLFGPLTALSLREVRHANGTALAIQGSVQFIVAGITAVAVGLGGAQDIRPLVVVYSVLAFWAIFASRRARKITVQ